ncbi:MAG: aldo/keto reductase [Alphaproteobacteria bacterium]|nr:aldo/keto reductase [Alphaproteobacteria bacterium]
MTNVPVATLPGGEKVAALGQGTWNMGDSSRRRKEEVAALKLGFDLGMMLVDTAEMYASGGAEEVIAEAIAGRRDEIFIVSKVMPQNASRRGTIAACEKSLKRLKVDSIDLYLLHWPGSSPFSETLEGFTALTNSGKIRYWGVSNFDQREMEEVIALSGGGAVATDQVMYNLNRRGIEFSLTGWCEKHHIPIMAYSPLDQGKLLRSPAVENIADRHSATAAQVALAWVLRQTNMIVIPKAGSEAHVRENYGALKVRLDAQEMAELDRAFPPPGRKKPLEST